MSKYYHYLGVARNLSMDHRALDTLFRLLEIHGYRVIYFLFMCCALYHFSVLNFPMVLLSVFGACFPSSDAVILPLLCVYILAVSLIHVLYHVKICLLHRLFDFVNIFQFNGIQMLLQNVDYNNYSIARVQHREFKCSEFREDRTTSEFRYTYTWIGFRKSGSFFPPNLVVCFLPALLYGTLG